MKLIVEYDEINLQTVEDNPHLIFICDGDKKQITLEEEEE